MIAPNQGEVGSSDQNPHIDTLGSSFEVENEICEPMYTAVVGVTCGPGTKISNHSFKKGISATTILQEEGPGDFVKLFEGLECVDKYLPPMTITIFPSNVIHAGAQGPEDFLCPYTQSKNRITYTFFFSPAILEKLQNHDGINVFKGFGAGIYDMINYNISDILPSLISRTEAFSAACVAHISMKPKRTSKKKDKPNAKSKKLKVK